MNKQHSRKALRQLIRERRNALSAPAQSLAARQLQQRLCRHPKVKGAQHLALYLSNDGELDVMPFIHWCWQQQKNVYLPVIHPFTKGQLLFLRFDENSTMTTNKFGIKEPVLDVRNIHLVSQLDVLFTPLVAFDSSGARLGMGGGFYDRTLAHWYAHQAQSSLSPIGIAHDCQLVEKIPCEDWDIPIPEIITPTQNIIC